MTKAANPESSKCTSVYFVWGGGAVETHQKVASYAQRSCAWDGLNSDALLGHAYGSTYEDTKYLIYSQVGSTDFSNLPCRFLKPHCLLQEPAGHRLWWIHPDPQWQGTPYPAVWLQSKIRPSKKMKSLTVGLKKGKKKKTLDI